MPLPDFNAAGDLPEGIHPATLEEVVARFGGHTTERQQATHALQQMHEIVRRTGRMRRLVLFGSYVSTKTEPHDLDLVFVMDGGFCPADFDAEVQSIFDHQSANDTWGASIFWLCSSSVLLGSVDDCLAV